MAGERRGGGGHAGRRRALGALAALPLAACAGLARRPAAPPPPTPSFAPLATAIPTRAPTLEPEPEPAGQPSPVPDTGWLSGPPGLELRRARIPFGDAGGQAPIVIARIDTAAHPLRVRYDPQRPRLLSAWAAAEQPTLAINGGYFGESYASSALVISDGAAFGESYSGFGGMLAAHADGSVELRALRDQPYAPGEPIAHATQSAPMLIFPGGAPADFRDDGARARRSAAAIDSAGRLLLIAAPTSALTLSELASWLLASDLQVDRALNLDGGTSTGLIVAGGALEETIDSFAPLPIVIMAGTQIAP